MEVVRTFSRLWGVLLTLGVVVSATWGQNSDYNPPAGYYNSATGLTRTALKAALHEIIDEHVQFPYTSGSTDTWNILRDCDQDTNNTANVLLIYNGASVNGAQEYNNGQGWTREHVWPQSLGGFDTDKSGPGTDCHNLRACNGSINSIRSNLEFDNGGIEVTGEGLTSTFKDGNSFEPNPAFKGDVARIIFYMAVRYEGGLNEPDLEIDDLTNGGTFSFGKLSTLLLWHDLDPVDEFERRRNSRIARYQGNRNPFIDHPEYAQAIWGTQLVAPIITWSTPAQIFYGTALSTTQLNATSSVAGTFVYTPKAGTILNAGTNELKAVFTTTSAGYVSPVTNTVNLIVAKVTPTISVAPTASPILVGQTLSVSQLSGGMAIVAGGFAWTVPTTIPLAGTNSYGVTFTPTNGINYNTASTTVTIVALTPFQSWAAGYGWSGPQAAAGADPDGDGWSNAQEFAFGLAPNVAGGTLVKIESSGSEAKITYLQRSEVTYTVKSAADLAAGFTGTVIPSKSDPQPSGLPDGYEQWEATLTGGDKGFLKVEATVP